MPTLYTTPHCPKCQLVKTLLTKAKIEYQVCEDTGKAIALGIKSAPTLVEGDKMYTMPEIVRMCKETEAKTSEGKDDTN